MMVGYTRLTAAIIIKAADDFRRGNSHAEDAGQFLAGPWAAWLTETLGLDPEHLGRFLASEDRRPVRQIKADAQVEEILGLYRRDPRLKQRQVAEMLGINNSAVFEDLRRLEREGRVVRHDGTVKVVD